MILLKEWIPCIPEEDRHIAYVGENGGQKREILLTCKDWKTYSSGYEFYLDIGFDLSSVTSVDQRQMVETQVESTENISETVVKTNANTTETSYTVKDVQVDCASKTDVVHLGYRVEGGGIRMYWDIAKEHTQLPGHLYCTLRAVHLDGTVKKSGLMVFDVDPAVVATPAAKITDNEFQQMEGAMQTLLVEARGLTANAETAATQAVAAANRLTVDQKLDGASPNPVSNRILTPILEQLLSAKDVRDEKVEENTHRIANLEGVVAEADPRLGRIEDTLAEAAPRIETMEDNLAATDSRIANLETAVGEIPPRLDVLETVAEEVGPRLVALEQRPDIVVDDMFDTSSKNPIENQAVATAISGISNYLYGEVARSLLPRPTSDKTYYIPRVQMYGGGYELIPLEEEAFIQRMVLPYLLPRVTENDNGKTLQVVNGQWMLV